MSELNAGHLRQEAADRVARPQFRDRPGAKDDRQSPLTRAGRGDGARPGWRLVCDVVWDGVIGGEGVVRWND